MSDFEHKNVKAKCRGSKSLSLSLTATALLLFAHSATALTWEVYFGNGGPPDIPVGIESSYGGAVAAMLLHTNTSVCNVLPDTAPGSAYFFHGPYEPVFNSGEWIFTGWTRCLDIEGNAYGSSLYTALAPDCVGDGSEMPPCGDQSAVASPPGPCLPPPPDVPVVETTNPCDPATGNKSQAEIDYASDAVGGLSLTRYYNSSGPYKTGEGMPAGWRHTYSRAIDEEPDRHATLTFSVAGGQSSNYSNSSDACTAGWGEIKDTVWSGDLSTGTAVFVGGNTCKISMAGSTAAYFPVREKNGWATFTQATNLKTVTRPHGAVQTFEFDGSNWINHLDPTVTLAVSGSNWVYTTANNTEETYNSAGQLTTITYRNGRTEGLEYDLTGVQGGDGDSSTLDKVTGPFGHVLTLGYDAGGNLATVNTPDGAIQYVNGSNKNISTVTYPDATIRQYLFESGSKPNHLTGIIDENGDRYATWAYDYTGRAVLSEHAGGKEKVELAYNPDGTTTLTMANGAERVYSYSTERGHRRLTSLTGNVCGTCTQGDTKNRTYDSNGYVAEVTDWNGNVTKTARNSRGLVETLTEALGEPEQRVTTTLWHANFRLPTQATSPNNVTDYTYDANGNVLSITVAGGGDTRTWSFTYNADGQPLTINGPRTTVTDITTLEYYVCTTGNECGQLKKVTNALAHVTTYDSYDSAGRLTQMSEPNGLQTSFAYNSRGQVITIAQTPLIGTARVTTMTYDGVGQLATQTLPDGATLTYAYDAAHYLTSVTDNLGNSVAYDYDAMGNRTDEDTYDPAATLKRALDYAYDLNDRIDTVSDGGFTSDLTLDLVGNLTSSTDPNTNTTQQTYDALNRLDTTIDALTGVIDYNYDDHDNLTQVVAANGATTNYVYDNLDNLLSETSPDRGLTTYTYDDAGNRLTATDARGVVSTYAYDALDRLISVSYPDTAENIVYGYDDVASNGIGRLTSVSDQSGTISYDYDAFGSVASDSRKISGVTYVTAYQYDAAGNASSITYPSGRTIDYGRDLQLRRYQSFRRGLGQQHLDGELRP